MSGDLTPTLRPDVDLDPIDAADWLYEAIRGTAETGRGDAVRVALRSLATSTTPSPDAVVAAALSLLREGRCIFPGRTSATDGDVCFACWSGAHRRCVAPKCTCAGANHSPQTILLRFGDFYSSPRRVDGVERIQIYR